MKKLVLAFAVAASAALLNAATVSWSASKVSEYGTTTAAPASLGYYAILINADITGVDTMLSKLATNDTSLIATSMITGSEGVWNQSVAGFVSAKNAGSFGNSQTINAYALIFDGAIGSAKHVIATDVLQKTTGASGQAATFGFGDLSAKTGNAENWTSIAPEPTSGLLMLLGMGALALRRRRA